MLAYGWLVGAAVLGASVATAALLLWILARMTVRADRTLALEAQRGARRCVMLFDGMSLLDATPPARALVDGSPGRGDVFTRVMRALEARFGALHEALGELEARGSFDREADGARLEARWCDGLTRIEVVERGAVAGPPDGVEDDRLAAVEEELRVLRAAAEGAPWPIWHTGPNGRLDWANAAYVDRAGPSGEKGLRGWPPPALFEGPADAHGSAPASEDGLRDGADGAPAPRTAGIAAALEALGGRRRNAPVAHRSADATGGLRPGGPVRRLRASDRAGDRFPADAAEGPDDPEAWYDCVARPGVVPGAAIHFATPAAAAVRAERTLEQFVQTLTKTFAHLPVGLAVFDSRRGLSLFNPALTDLTTLPVDFLSSRPTLPTFIDALREARRMPEPRDYRSWRDRITALEAASAEGTYLETWSLPTGQTWRVSGRPHPDGAIALVFEDITAEIAVTRRFRSELKMGQSVVDAMEEAIAVFAPDGVLTLANEAYARLWDSDPRQTLGDMTITDASRGWMARCMPSPLWGELRDFVAQVGERAAWSGEAWLHDGRRVACRAVPLSAGATLVGFSAEAIETAASPRLIEMVADTAAVRPVSFQPDSSERADRPEPGSRLKAGG